MYDLLTINDVAFETPDTFTVSDQPKLKEYDSESGGKVIEIIKNSNCSISVGYDSLSLSTMKIYENAVFSIPLAVKYFDTAENQVVTKQMKRTKMSKSKNFYKFGTQTWSFSFELEEI